VSLYRFGVVTPTVADRGVLLKRCRRSIDWQWRNDVRHIVYGDGFTPESPVGAVAFIDRSGRDRKGHDPLIGNDIRNKAVQEWADKVDLFVFVDDDNILLPGALNRFEKAAAPVVLSRMLEISTDGRQRIYPKPEDARLIEGNFGSLQICVASEIAKDCRFTPDRYNGDWDFIQQALAIAGREAKAIEDITGIWCREGV